MTGRRRGRRLLAAAGLVIVTSCASDSRATDAIPTDTAPTDAAPTTLVTTPSGKAAPSGSGPALTWLYDDDDGAAIDCVYRYPEDLAARPIAFDGTVLGIQRFPYSENAGAAPVDLLVQVNRVFRGDLGDTVTMHSWDFTGPGGEPWDPTGVRILAAAGNTLDVMACGFTRSYSDEDAALWADIFAAPQSGKPTASTND